MTQEQGKLSTLECVMIVVGGAIGTAVFSLSGLTYSMAGAAVLISWIIGGLILLMYGLQTAELSVIYPQSGGMFVFPYETLGKDRVSKEGWGWFAAWSLLNVNIFGAGFSAIYFSTYLGNSFTVLANYQVQLAVILSLVCGILCLFNITVAGRFNLGITFVHIAIMLLFSIMCFTSSKFNPSNFTPFFTRGSLGGSGFISGIPLAMLAYNAIACVAFMANQVKDPKKTIPKSMIISIIIAIVINCLAILATIGMLAVEMLNAPDTSWIQYVSMFAVAKLILSNVWLQYLITLAAAMALTTTTLVLLMTAGWTVQAAADRGLLPQFLGKVNPKTGTPAWAMVFVTLAIAIVSCFPNFVSQIANCGAICSAVMVVIISITLLAARKQHPYVEGDFRVPGGTVLPIITIALILFFIIPGVFQAWSYWALSGCWYVLGLVIFLLCQIRAKKRA